MTYFLVYPIGKKSPWLGGKFLCNPKPHQAADVNVLYKSIEFIPDLFRKIPHKVSLGILVGFCSCPHNFS